MFINLKYFMFGVRYYHVAYGNESFTMRLVANYVHFLGVTSGGVGYFSAFFTHFSFEFLGLRFLF